MDWSRYPAAFKYSCEHTLGREGLLVNNPFDRGGKTKFGITQRLASKYGYNDVSLLELDQAVRIYYLEFWESSAAVYFTKSQYVQAELFDTSVLCGPRTAGMLLQRAYNVLFDDQLLVDGVIGPKTLVAINAVLPKWEKSLLNAMTGEQYLYFKAITDKDPTQKTFIKGWVGKRLDVPDDAKEA